MIEFILSILLIIVVMPAALVLGVKLAWYLIKKLFKRFVSNLEDWLNKNGL